VLQVGRGPQRTQVAGERLQIVRRDAGHRLSRVGRRLFGPGRIALADHRARWLRRGSGPVTSVRRLEARPSGRVLTQWRSPAWCAYPAWPLGPGGPGRTGPAVLRRPPVRRTRARPARAGLCRATSRTSISLTSTSRTRGAGTDATRAGAARPAGAARTGASRSWSRPAGSVTARWRPAGPAPAVRVVVLDGRPRSVMPAGSAAGYTRSRRPVQAVRARRHPPTVRQPVPARSRRTVGPAGIGPARVGPTGVGPTGVEHRAVGYRPPVRHGPAMRGSAVRGNAMRRSAPRGSPVLG